MKAPLSSILTLAFLLATFLSPARAATSHIDELRIDGTIQPIAADQLRSAIATAHSDGARALLISIDTPGGLLDSTRTMAGAILSSPIPVILYVDPAGARAGSAGFFLLESADIAAMAPGTNAGAAHPVSSMGKMDETMAHKVENDAAAFLRSYVTRRNRNPQAAEDAVRNSLSYTAEEALNLHLIDLVATDRAHLLSAIDGRTITRLDGSQITLSTANANIQLLRPSLRDHLLTWLMNPNIALLFLIGGGLLIYLEFNSPGTIVPGALGTLMVLLSIFALNLLPIRYTSALLLIAAFVMLLLEAKFGAHGILALAGIVSLGFGMATLVAAPIPEMAVMPSLAIALSLTFGAITVFLVRLALRAKKNKIRLGADALIGSNAIALSPINPVGQVLVEGEIWRATSSLPVEKDAALIVLSHDAGTLQVAPATSPQP